MEVVEEKPFEASDAVDSLNPTSAEASPGQEAPPASSVTSLPSKGAAALASLPGAASMEVVEEKPFEASDAVDSLNPTSAEASPGQEAPPASSVTSLPSKGAAALASLPRATSMEVVEAKPQVAQEHVSMSTFQNLASHGQAESPVSPASSVTYVLPSEEAALSRAASMEDATSPSTPERRRLEEGGSFAASFDSGAGDRTSNDKKIEDPFATLLTVIAYCAWPFSIPTWYSLLPLFAGTVALCRLSKPLPIQVRVHMAFYQTLGCFAWYAVVMYDQVREKVSWSQSWVLQKSFPVEDMPHMTGASQAFLLILITCLSLFSCADRRGAVLSAELWVLFKLEQVDGQHTPRLSIPLFASRVLVIGCVLVMIIADVDPGYHGLLVQLGYMTWFVGFVTIGEPGADTLDGLRGNVGVWKVLLVLSSCFQASLLVFCGHDSLSLIFRQECHFVIALFAALQVNTVRGRVKFDDMSMLQAFASVALYISCCVFLCLLLTVILIPPPTWLAFILLVIVVAMVWVTHFRVHMLKTVYFGAVTISRIALPIWFLVYQCEVQKSERFHFWWFLSSDDLEASRLRLMCLALLALLSRLMGATLESYSEEFGRLMHRSPTSLTAARRLFIADHLAPLFFLVCAGVLLLQMHSSAEKSLGHQVALCFLLLILLAGRKWRTAGPVCAVLSCVSLLAQYLQLLGVADWKVLVVWNIKSVCCHISVVALALMQHLLHERALVVSKILGQEVEAVELDSQSSGSGSGLSSAAHNQRKTLISTCAHDTLATAGQMHRANSDKDMRLFEYDVQVAACGVMVVGLLHHNMYSLLEILVAGLFFSSRTSTNVISRRRSRCWMQVMAFTVVLPIILTWLIAPFDSDPSEMLPRISWCNQFTDEGGVIFVNHTLSLCNASLAPTTCVSQREACQHGFANWFVFFGWRTSFGIKQGITLFVFIGIVLLCWASNFLTPITTVYEELPVFMNRLRRPNVFANADPVDSSTSRSSSHVSRLKTWSYSQDSSDEDSEITPKATLPRIQAALPTFPLIQESSSGEKQPTQGAFRTGFPSSSRESSLAKDSMSPKQVVKVVRVQEAIDSDGEDSPSATQVVKVVGFKDSIDSTGEDGISEDSSSEFDETKEGLGRLSSMRSSVSSVQSQFAHRTYGSMAKTLSEIAKDFSTADSSSGTSFQVSEVIGLVVVLWLVILSWVTIIVPFIMMSEEVTVQCVVQLWLLFLDLVAVVLAPRQDEPTSEMLGACNLISRSSVLMIVILMFYEFPMFPCLCHHGDTNGAFLTEDQCAFVAQQMRHKQEAVPLILAEKSPAQICKEIGGAKPTPWLLIIQSFGLRKKNGTAFGNLSGLFNLLILVVCSARRCAITRWRNLLHRALLLLREVLQRHASWYIQEVVARRHTQLVSWDTKQEVLLGKLRRIVEELRQVRAIWDHRRPPLTRGEQQQGKHMKRLEDMCLKSGVTKIVVEELMKQFDAAACTEAASGFRVEQTEVSYSDEADGEATRKDVMRMWITSEVDKLLHAFLIQRMLRKQRKIKLEEEEEAKNKLLQKCRALDPNPPAPGRRRGGLGQTTRPTGQPTLRDVEGQAEPEGPVDGPVEEVAQRGWLSQFIYNFLSDMIDDMVFIGRRDTSLSEHKQGNSMFQIFCKALLSQINEILVIATVLQSYISPSIFSAVILFMALLSLKQFPHVSLSYWVRVSKVCFLTICLKLLFQLPIFCPDMKPRFYADQDCVPDATWTKYARYIGLRKVGTPGIAPELSTYDYGVSPLTNFGADFVVFIVVIITQIVAMLAGRFEDPNVLMQQFLQHDEEGTLSTFHDSYSFQRRSLEEHAEEEQLGFTFSSEGTSEPSTFFRGGAASMRGASRIVARISSWNFNPIYHFRRMRRHIARAYRRTWRRIKMQREINSLVRRPAKDLYGFRNVLLVITVLCLVQHLKAFLVGFRTSVLDHFGVVCFVLFFLYLILDRFLYTLYRQHPWFGADSAASMASKDEVPIGSENEPPGGSIGGSVEEQTSQVRSDRYSDVRSTARLGQLALLLIVFVFIQSLWICATQRTNFAYLAMTLSIAVTFRQLYYDVHMTRGGLRLTHESTLPWHLMFLAYMACPFLHELRIFIDWTCTRTSLNVFMWMKLEDAHHNLVRVRRDMHTRLYVTAGASRPCGEKLMMGAGILLLLCVVLLGPLISFSDFLVKTPDVTRSSLSVRILAKNPTTQWSEVLFDQDTTEMRFHPVNNYTYIKSLLGLETLGAAKTFSFPAVQYNGFDISDQRRRQLADFINMSAEEVDLELTYTYQINKATSSDSPDQVSGSTLTTRDTVSLLKYKQGIVEVLLGDRVAFDIPNAIAAYRYISSFSQEQRAESPTRALPPRRLPARLTLVRSDAVPSRAEWSFSRARDENRDVFKDSEQTCDFTIEQCREESCHILFIVLVGQIALLAEFFGSSVTALYTGFVIVFWRALNGGFRDRSKFVIYEEMPDTSMIIDLISGIYIARNQGDLMVEWRLYHELLAILRSPELLMLVTSKTQLVKAREARHGYRSDDERGMDSQRHDLVGTAGEGHLGGEAFKRAVAALQRRRQMMEDEAHGSSHPVEKGPRASESPSANPHQERPSSSNSFGALRGTSPTTPWAVARRAMMG
eukprot:TRINITY_DN1650_c0_g1_i12.p1 TRINITY_DN1650_c0_g1~~TRINITY_DN1650_c0_g1_i12.p1  ORF type:complete len:2631 (-),score=386.72 TRINITY_DN1650_c0_g1_i12:114-7970(-)